MLASIVPIMVVMSIVAFLLLKRKRDRKRASNPVHKVKFNLSNKAGEEGAEEIEVKPSRHYLDDLSDSGSLFNFNNTESEAKHE